MKITVRCKFCKTTFSLNLVQEQLQASGGRIRCGSCHAVFSVDQKSIIKTPIQNTPIQETNLTSVEKYHLPTKQLSFMQQAQRKRLWASPVIQVLFWPLALLLLLLLSVQIVHREHERLSRYALLPLQSAISQLCNIWPCKTIHHRQIDGWFIENSGFEREGSDAFKLTATLKNVTAEHLLIPRIELSLLDLNETVLVRRVIALEESEATASMPSGAEKTYVWLIQLAANNHLLSDAAGAKGVTGYRLMLFYP